MTEKETTLQKGTGLSIHPAEARLAVLHKAARTGECTLHALLAALEEGEPKYEVGMIIEKQMPIVSFRDIGMSSIHELIEAFERLDAAIKRDDKIDIEETLSKLIPPEKEAEEKPILHVRPRIIAIIGGLRHHNAILATATLGILASELLVEPPGIKLQMLLPQQVPNRHFPKLRERHADRAQQEIKRFGKTPRITKKVRRQRFR